jgi:hypothetical protein
MHNTLVNIFYIKLIDSKMFHSLWEHYEGYIYIYIYQAVVYKTTSEIVVTVVS